MIWVAAALALGPVDVDRLEHDVFLLTGDRPTADGSVIASRHILHPDHAAAEAVLLDALGNIDGLRVWTEPVEARGVVVHNLIGELVGTHPTLAPIVVGAHYDSTASSTEGWVPETDPAPGGDDDASGVAVVLETARLLAAEPGYARTVRFILFTAEEVGLVGSEAYVDAHGPAHWMVSLDPVGFNPASQDNLFVVYDERWPEPAAHLTTLGADREDIEVLDVERSLIGGDERSDHAPFWDDEQPAVHIATFPQPEAYHTVQDTVEMVDFTFLPVVTEVVASWVAAEAGPLSSEDNPRTCSTLPSSSWLACCVMIGLRRRRKHTRD